MVKEVLAAKNSKVQAPSESSQLTKQESEVNLQKPSSVDNKADLVSPTALQKPTEPVSKALDEPTGNTNNTPVREVTDKKL